MDAARRMHLEITGKGDEVTARSKIGPVLTLRVPERDKRIRYNPESLLKIDPAKAYSAADVVTAAMKVFARDTQSGFNRFGSWHH